VIVLSPRAVERLENYTPSWPLPKIFRLTKAGKLIEGIFEGATINTPSMLCVEDYLDALNWADTVGGLAGLKQRSEDNLAVLKAWVDGSDDVEFLAKDPATVSNTSVCINIVADWFSSLSDEDQAAAAKKVASLLDAEEAAYDIGAYRDAPAGLRIWAGSTVEASDLAALTPWVDWAIAEVKNAYV